MAPTGAPGALSRPRRDAFIVLPRTRIARDLCTQRSLSRHRRVLGYWAVVIGMTLSLWVGTQWHPDARIRLPFLFLHLASVIAGLGATVVLDARALRWVIGRDCLADVLTAEHSVTPLAWLGVAGLIFTGAFLAPDLSQPLTALKMAAVSVAALNGVALGRLTDELRRMPTRIAFRRTPAQMKLWCAASATLSQVAWWLAVALGTMNTTSR